MNKENIPCCFSEVNEVGKHITNCNNLPTKLDKDNVQVRYFCEEHMIKVEKIRRKMAQKYINEYKEKLLKYLKNLFMETDSWQKQIIISTNLIIREELIKKIENGEFD
ncbi:hypothetical protein [Spiroplasma endosymbiont of Villa modesta]|uniref:hypothetical protein n=1 Tax=Spiroplasma endosymbiont of Villa modesta TaxID=3066293 RepID=UPI00313EE71E